MGRPAQNTVRVLHPEQEKASEKAWERLPGEPPKWFLRFTRYRLMGRDRSLQATIAQERADEQAIASHKQTKTKRSFPLDSLPKPPGASEEVSKALVPLKEVKAVPGSWKNASVRWRWVERAEAWDIAEYEAWNAELTKEVRLGAEFTNQAYRLHILNCYADFLSKIVIQTPGQSHLILGTGSASPVVPSQFTKPCCTAVFYKSLEKLDAIALIQTPDHDPQVTMRDRMIAIKLSQDIMRDIRREMGKLEDPPSRR